MEKVYDIMFKQNDHYSRIYGDPSPLKGAASTQDKKRYSQKPSISPQDDKKIK